jgi:hypothetical protein
MHFITNMLDIINHNVHDTNRDVHYLCALMLVPTGALPPVHQPVPARARSVPPPVADVVARKALTATACLGQAIPPPLESTGSVPTATRVDGL